ncbi:vomeronasal type-2 receptor 26-like [Spea bombifrons]|uniref:vomeronasal type-2 receptor 26-like n=1 Tax=Spea bombifrons TaxID=233779 RepID=UPI00234B6A3F|nr:vomeronasal type-2 receptor 26-like [Spea bombifrons]
MVEEINNSSLLLPNVTVGFQIYDACTNELIALKSTMNILSGSNEPIPNYTCQSKSMVSAFIGHFLPSVTKAVASLTQVYRYPQINDYMENTHIRAPDGEVIFSYEKGDPHGRFDIVNWVVFEDGLLLKNLVGHFFSLTPEQLLINKSVVIWHPDFTQIPKSVCSEICPLGFRKMFQNERPHCCYDCIPCSAGEIANVTGMDNCIRCPEDEWPNPSRTQCIKRLVDFLSYEDHLGIVFTCLSALLCTITTEVLWLFVKHRCSPIVKANNRNLSYVLLVSIMLSFLCSLLFIGRPWGITCLLRQVMFGCIFSVVISSVLGKTLTVVLAFNASKPGSKLKKWLGSRLSISLVLFSSLGEFLICITWLITAPPFVEHDTKTTTAMIIIQCNEGSIVALCLAMTYIGALALLSFMVAFMARKLPDTFNEAQYITFSMLVFLSVWITFIPAYLSTKGKYMVAVEIFAILASTAGILGCIFIPKCYIIYFKPELNTKRHLMKIRARRNVRR